MTSLPSAPPQAPSGKLAPAFSGALAKDGMFWGPLSVAYGGYEVVDAIQKKDVIKGAIGTAYVASGAVMTAASTRATLPLVSSALGGASQSGIIKGAGYAMLGAAAASVAYKAYNEQGTGPDDKLSYQLARAGVGSSAIGGAFGGAMLASKMGLGPVGASVASLVACSTISLGGHYLIDASKEEKIAQRSGNTSDVGNSSVITSSTTKLGNVISRSFDHVMKSLVLVMPPANQPTPQKAEITNALEPTAVLPSSLPYKGPSKSAERLT